MRRPRAGRARLSAARVVRLRPVGVRDLPWLTATGLDPEKVGRQYHWAEAPLQLGIAPARAVLGPLRPAALVEVDGRRAGYIGPNPLSGNLEYFLQPWARGGTGTTVITTYLRDHRAGDRARTFFVSGSNDRSLRTLLGAFDRLGWVEGPDYRITAGRHGRRVLVRGDGPLGPPADPAAVGGPPRPR